MSRLRDEALVALLLADQGDRERAGGRIDQPGDLPAPVALGQVEVAFDEGVARLELAPDATVMGSSAARRSACAAAARRLGSSVAAGPQASLRVSPPVRRALTRRQPAGRARRRSPAPTRTIDRPIERRIERGACAGRVNAGRCLGAAPRRRGRASRGLGRCDRPMIVPGTLSHLLSWICPPKGLRLRNWRSRPRGPAARTPRVARTHYCGWLRGVAFVGCG